MKDQDNNITNSAPDVDADINAETSTETVTNEPADSAPAPRKKKPKFSGAYWYSDKDDDELKRQTFTRTLLTVIALLLQLVVLLLPQDSLRYVTENIPSYAYVYMWFVFVMLGVSIYVLIMNMTRYKLVKRIPIERAPRNGFKRRSFFGAELIIAVYALIFILELSFICIHFDGFGLTGMFLSLLSVGATVWARQITVMTLKDATLIPAPTDTDTQEQTQQ